MTPRPLRRAIFLGLPLAWTAWSPVAGADEPPGAGLPPCPPEAAAPADGSCDPFAFSNGNRIRQEDGSTIDPRSVEGLQIEALLRRQRRDAEENAAQAELFSRMTRATSAAEAERVLQEAKALNPDAGTPNRIVPRGEGVPQRREAETVRLREALTALERGETLSGEQQSLVDKHFPEGVMFLSKEEYRRAVATAPETLDRGVVTVEPSGRVDIHTKVGVRSTKMPADERFRFSDGRRFARKDGTLIDPKSPDGGRIEGMLAEREASREPTAEREARLAGARREPDAERKARLAGAKRESAEDRAAAWRKTRGDPAYTFSSGNQIRRKGGAPIRTDSAEGKQIEAILERQRRDRAANAAQKELFWKVTRADNAQEALEILRAAKAKDPNAGTPNTVYRKDKKK